MNSSAAGRSSSTAHSIRTDTVSPRGMAARQQTATCTAAIGSSGSI